MFAARSRNELFLKFNIPWKQSRVRPREKAHLAVFKAGAVIRLFTPNLWDGARTRSSGQWVTQSSSRDYDKQMLLWETNLPSRTNAGEAM